MAQRSGRLRDLRQTLRQVHVGESPSDDRPLVGWPPSIGTAAPCGDDSIWGGRKSPAALYMGALVATRHNPVIKDFYMPAAGFPIDRSAWPSKSLSSPIVVLLTSELSLIDDKDDAVVCLYTVLSYTTLRDTTARTCAGAFRSAASKFMTRTSWRRCSHTASEGC